MAIGHDAAEELFGSLSRLLRSTRGLSHRNRELGATGTTLGVLKTLLLGDARPGDLAAALHVVPSVMSRTIGPLELDGLVERKPDPADARASLIGLTELGRQRLDAVQQVYVHQLRQTFASWTDDEAEQASRLLDRLEHSLAGYHQPEVHRQQLTEALLHIRDDDSGQHDSSAGPGTVAGQTEHAPEEDHDQEQVLA
jgi:DNA-binding MarR family transcriptional regulator